MTPVRAIGSRLPAPPTRGQASDQAPPATTGRAVVALAPVAPSEPSARTSRRPRADFLAHLIATAQQAPQTRDKRRAEPGVAIAAYVKMQDSGQAGGQTRLHRVA